MHTRPDLLDQEDLAPAPRQKRSIEKRERLKNAALESFGTKGYEATSIEEIAATAGLAVGGFYQHYRSKRQLLLALMDELLEHLSRLDLKSLQASGDVRQGLRDVLQQAFSRELHYLGAYRAWQEAILSDSGLAVKQRAIRKWTTHRILGVFKALQKLPGARQDVNIQALARTIDTFFWTLLGEASMRSKRENAEWLDASVHLIYHAMFLDSAPATAYRSSQPSSRTSRAAGKRSAGQGRRPQR